MTTIVGYEDFTRMMIGAVEAIKKDHQLLSSLDAAIGDGDHGVTMLRAMHKVEAIVEAGDPALDNLIYEIGWALLGIDGGATGPLLGSFFIGMSDGVGDNETLDGPALATMFEAGLSSIQQQTKARVGDKTMLDALIPAVQALRQAADANKSVTEMLDAAAEAAQTGAVSTQELEARLGRARHQGTRTIGHLDPGAMSISLMFQGFRDGLK